MTKMLHKVRQASSGHLDELQGQLSKHWALVLCDEDGHPVTHISLPLDTWRKMLPTVDRAASGQRGGRPRKDDIDQTIVNAAAFMMEVVETGPQGARDLVVAWFEGQEIEPTEEIGKEIFRGAPRRARRLAADGAELHSFVLPENKKIRLSEAPANRFRHRGEAICGKGLKPQPEVLQAWRDIAKIVRAYLLLLALRKAATGAPPKAK